METLDIVKKSNNFFVTSFVALLITLSIAAGVTQVSAATDSQSNQNPNQNQLKTQNVQTSTTSNHPITTNEIADNAVTSPKIKNGEVRTDDLANNAVTTDKIKDGTIKKQDIRPGEIIGTPGPAGPAGPKGDKGDPGTVSPPITEVRYATTTVSAGAIADAIAVCPPDEVVSGGGFFTTDAGIFDILVSQAVLGNPGEWRVVGKNIDTVPHDLTAQVVCLSFAP